MDDTNWNKFKFMLEVHNVYNLKDLKIVIDI